MDTTPDKSTVLLTIMAHFQRLNVPPKSNPEIKRHAETENLVVDSGSAGRGLRFVDIDEIYLPF